MTTDTYTEFASAARGFAALVATLPAGSWGGPGLGEWDLRALVGHTSRSLTTVSTYLTTRAAGEDVRTPADYYLRVTPEALGIDPAAVAERGRQAGRDLGGDPASAVAQLVERALTDAAAAGDPLIEVIGGMGIRLSTYLPTRTFELVVHGLDIARAAGVAYVPPADALAAAVDLAAQVAVASGQGEVLLVALTGRASLPPGFSVV
ncbi:maleylpyruvate isomerase N-terminal domain-containing protein [Mycolicibacterium sp. S2-37]|uniref:maleylpyruvate isomerase family mycothiol-dependent enzyme n=1 Tax=Mycolicibacterium sp. S2-37 TaxID=2810297 RepID=UPI001A9524AE|nr:maleylpyruvate isomerase family mycothiol-dependent enzyme [Mycolicibacterium sp. S2-37]MBO0680260.1 maleylpyruvate isomerase N-terminal domain-containing protein [Mycolicibacterium sp. S2-37]